MYQLKAQQRQIGRTHTEENVTAVDKLVLSQQNQPQIHRSTYQKTQSGVVRIMFFDRDHGLKCFKIRLLKKTDCSKLPSKTQLLKTVAE